MDVQNKLEMSELRPKQNRRPEPLKHSKDPNFGYLGVFNFDFFRYYETFPIFFNYTKGSPFNCFDNLQQNGC